MSPLRFKAIEPVITRQLRSNRPESQAPDVTCPLHPGSRPARLVPRYGDVPGHSKEAMKGIATHVIGWPWQALRDIEHQGMEL